MKKNRMIIMIFLVLGIILNENIVTFAKDDETNVRYVKYSIENNENLSNYNIISTENYIKNDRLITKTVYQQPDGTIITDTLDISAIAPASRNGSDTATRTRTISGWGSVSITASFKWYTKGMFSYVKCTSMSASHSLDSRAKVSTWEKNYTKDYLSIGTAKAQVKYYFYNSKNPAQYQDGTFKITCSDEGTISDNN